MTDHTSERPHETGRTGGTDGTDDGIGERTGERTGTEPFGGVEKPPRRRP